LLFDATPAPNTVTNGVAPASRAFTSSSAGVFYWQAIYGGDANNPGATSVCADERLTVAVSTAAQLLVKKHVINDSGGGSAVAGQFGIRLDLNGSPAAFFAGDEAGVVLDLPRDAIDSASECTGL